VKSPRLALIASLLIPIASGQAQEDKPFQLKSDVAGEALTTFMANHQDAECEKKIDHAQDCYSYSGFTFLGAEFKPQKGCSLKSDYGKCKNGSIGAHFVSDKLSWVAYHFAYSVGFGDDLAIAISAKYGDPVPHVAVGTPDPVVRNGHLAFCSFPLGRDHLYFGGYSWENQVSRLEISCASDSENNYVILYARADGSKTDF